MKRILLLVTILILYGSFYPWEFHEFPLVYNPLQILLHAWPRSIDPSEARDIAVNVVLYVPFGVACFLAIGESRSRWVRAFATLLAAVLLSAFVEMAQLFDDSRVTSLLDVLSNTTGAAIGILVASTFPKPISRVLSEAEATGVFRLSGVIALLYLWAGYQLLTLVPTPGVDSTGPIPNLCQSFAGWLAASALIESLMGRQRATWIVPFALLVVPLKLMILDRTPAASELAGGILAAGLWMIVRSSVRSRLIAGALALATIITAGLYPFQFFGDPQPFTWIPFLPLLQSPWAAALVTLLLKSFLYGSTIWLLNEAGRGWIASSLIVSTTLAGVEAAQIYLPGHTPEVTDPLLAILLGCSLMLLERHSDLSRQTRV